MSGDIEGRITKLERDKESKASVGFLALLLMLLVWALIYVDMKTDETLKSLEKRVHTLETR